MKLDQVRCNSIYLIRNRQSQLYHATSKYMIAPFSRPGGQSNSMGRAPGRTRETWARTRGNLRL